MFGFDQKKKFFRIREKRLSYPQLSERKSIILSRYASQGIIPLALPVWKVP